MKKLLKKSALLSLCLLPLCAHAEPFLTDDGTTLPYEDWEFELNSTLVFTNKGPDEQAFGFEVKYGLLTRVELFLEMGYEHISKDNEIPSLHGVGDSEIGFKYRFLDECAIGPKMAIAPRLGIPTGSKHVGNDRIWFELPLWIEKNWGDFSTSGGGGAVFNDATDAKNYIFAGWKVRYQVTENLNMGAEFFYQGKDADDNRDLSLLNLGSVFKLNEAFNLQLGLGHSIHGQDQTIVYLGIST
ncbi:MAG: transporter [Candidatus Berkiella sp.]